MAVAEQPEKESIPKNKSLDEKRRVVVTGVGVVSSLGHDADIFYNNLLEGVSGISQIETFDCSEFPTVSLHKSRAFQCFSFFPLFLDFGFGY